jgi:hypothetical protein
MLCIRRTTIIQGQEDREEIKYYGNANYEGEYHYWINFMSLSLIKKWSWESKHTMIKYVFIAQGDPDLYGWKRDYDTSSIIIYSRITNEILFSHPDNQPCPKL